MSGNSSTCEIDLDRLCGVVADSLGAEASGLALTSGESIRYVAGFGFDWTLLRPIPVGESLLGVVVAAGQTLASPDLREDARCKTVGEARSLGAAAFLGAAIRNERDDVIGAITVLKKQRFEWRAEHFRSIESAACMVSAFLSTVLRCRGYRGPLADHDVVTPSVRPVIRSAAIRAAYEKAGRVAKSRSSVLITGERGTGKELIARYIHERSRRSGSYVIVNCAALSEELLESELFGHVRGAYTGAHAHRVGAVESAVGGTLFLDEVAELSERNQGKLLRFLDNKEVRKLGTDRTKTVNVRVIAATNREIHPGSTAQFREDLYDRIAHYVIHVPALRQRPEDLDALISLFSADLMRDADHGVKGFAPAALSLLQSYPWPGNIRELRRVLSDAIVETAKGHWVGPETVRRYLTAALPNRPAPAHESLGSAVRRPSSDHFWAVYRKYSGDTRQMAHELGVSRRAVQRRIQRASAHVPRPDSCG